MVNQILRNRLLILMGVVVVGFIFLVAFGIGTVNKVKVGSQHYTEINDYKDLLEKATLLKSDLNEVRTLLLTMLALTDKDMLEQLKDEIKELTLTIDAEFNQVIGSIKEEEIKAMVVSALVSWKDFVNTRDNEIIPEIFSGDIQKAVGFAIGIQRQRYGRFIKEVDNAINQMMQKIKILQEDINEKVRRDIICLLLGNTILAVVIVFFCMIYIFTSKSIY